MILIFDIFLNPKKKAFFEFQKIYGIGKKIATSLCKKYNIHKDQLIEVIHPSTFYKLKAELKQLEIGNSLKKRIFNNIQYLKKLNNYRGQRHNKYLPIYGQRTKTNAKTCKKKRKKS